MIYDEVGSIGLYRGVARGLDTLIDWLEGADLPALPDGIARIDGDLVLANVMTVPTRTFEEGRFEVHRRYMDVQLDIVGSELFATTRAPVAPDGPFDPATDKGYGRVRRGEGQVLRGSLGGGTFAAFMPGEWHMPNIAPTGTPRSVVRKVCFKVLVDRYRPDAGGSGA